jgi:hypothetical protein
MSPIFSSLIHRDQSLPPPSPPHPPPTPAPAPPRRLDPTARNSLAVCPLYFIGDPNPSKYQSPRLGQIEWDPKTRTASRCYHSTQSFHRTPAVHILLLGQRCRRCFSYTTITTLPPTHLAHISRLRKVDNTPLAICSTGQGTPPHWLTLLFCMRKP